MERGGRAPRRAGRALSGGSAARGRGAARTRPTRSGGAGSTPSARPRSSDWPPPQIVDSVARRMSARGGGSAGRLGGGDGGRPGVQRRRRCWRCARTRCAAASWSSAPRHRPASAADGSRSPPGGLPTTPLAPRWPGWARPGPGVVLADWAALARMPVDGRRLRARGAHRSASFPAPRASGIRARAGGGPSGFLHLAWGEAEVELALRVHAEEWPLRPALVALYRALSDPERGTLRRRASRRRGRHPRSPEVAGRRLRVLEEAGRRSLGAVRHRARPPRRILGDEGSRATARPSSPTATGTRRAGDS